MERTLLLVDDEENITSALARLLRREGYQILRAGSGKEGLEILAKHEVGVIVSDQRMPEMTGTEFLSKVKELYPSTVRIMLSGYTELNSVTDAINRGAIYKFLTKPWDDDLLRENIQQAFRHYEMAHENERLKKELETANAALSAINQNLESRIAEKTWEVVRNMGLLQISQEIFEHLPVGVVGIDDEGMIVVANRMAHELFAGQADTPLIGDSALARIPQEVLCEAEAKSCDSTTHHLPGGHRVRCRCYGMGEHSRASGTVIVAWPEQD